MANRLGALNAAASSSSVTLSSTKDASDTPNSINDATPSKRELTDEELRRLYENEEIERFLEYFAAHVTEVSLPANPNALISGTDSSIDYDPDTDTDLSKEGEDWVSLNDSVTTIPSDPSKQVLPDDMTNKSFSERFAYKYMVPMLMKKPPRPAPPAFTLGRMRLTVQRFYMDTQPAYGPFFSNLVELAQWRDWNRSAVRCSVFWLLWWYNLLLPSLFAYLFALMLQHRIFSYPSKKELRERRKAAARAEELGERIEARLRMNSASSFGMKEAWRIYRVFVKKQPKASAEEKERAKKKVDAKIDGEKEKATVEIDVKEKGKAVDGKEGGDGKTAMLQSVSELADLHERIGNIFIWRRPSSSKVYAWVFFFLFLITAFLPARYLAKLTYFVGGAIYWHIMPVLACIPPADRKRLPPAFADVPTDAEYAMELISQRVARGESVKPPPPPSQHQHKFHQPHEHKHLHGTKKRNTTSTEGSDLLDDGSEEDVKRPKQKRDSPDVAWNKLSNRAAKGIRWLDESKRLFGGTESAQKGAWPPPNPLIPPTVFSHSQPEVEIETSTYPAHYIGPGLITLTPTMLLFTPLFSNTVSVQVRLEDITGVKKAGRMRGLILRVTSSDKVGETEEKKFRWVNERDELFAKLVGWRGRKWQAGG